MASGRLNLKEWKFSLARETGRRNYYNFNIVDQFVLFCDGIGTSIKNGTENIEHHFYSDHNWLILNLQTRKHYWYRLPHDQLIHFIPQLEQEMQSLEFFASLLTEFRPETRLESTTGNEIEPEMDILTKTIYHLENRNQNQMLKIEVETKIIFQKKSLFVEITSAKISTRRQL